MALLFSWYTSKWNFFLTIKKPLEDHQKAKINHQKRNTVAMLVRQKIRERAARKKNRDVWKGSFFFLSTSLLCYFYFCCSWCILCWTCDFLLSLNCLNCINRECFQISWTWCTWMHTYQQINRDMTGWPGVEASNFRQGKKGYGLHRTQTRIAISNSRMPDKSCWLLLSDHFPSLFLGAPPPPLGATKINVAGDADCSTGELARPVATLGQQTIDKGKFRDRFRD